MRIQDILQARRPAVSFEFFPPKTETGWDTLYGTMASLVPLHPAYVSVTYGAGGSTRRHTHDLVARLQRDTDLTVAAHLTCRESTRAEVYDILGAYRAAGVRNILALRGDAPPSAEKAGSGPGASEGFAYARDLVAFIKQHFPEMCVGVAGYPEGHPETPNRIVEMEHLQAKVDAGADYVVTQLMFDNRDYYDFIERCDLVGITVPKIAGIMPITSRRNLKRMADLSGGSRFPAPLLRALQWAEGEEYVRNVGVHWATEQVRDLVHNDVAGVHLYTLNDAYASMSICENLGLRSYDRIPAADARA